MNSLSSEELRRKRLQAATRLTLSVFSRLSDGTRVRGTRVLSKAETGTLRSTAILLRKFQVRPLPEDWGKTAEVFKPDPGDCENCPACVKWPESAHNKYLAEIRSEKAGKLFCCHGPYYLGSGDIKDRPRAITKRFRENCPLK
jgi:hypothetical protein